MVAVSLRQLRWIAKKTALLGCVGFTFQQYLACPWLLSESSMEPTFSHGQIVLSTAWYKSLQRGDVVIIKNPQKPTDRMCKRVIALPGDTVQYSYKSVIIPSGQMWVEGDNKVASLDSRDYGAVPIGLLDGLVICRLWPFATRESWTPENTSEVL